jgi:hypothetical protein
LSYAVLDKILQVELLFHITVLVRGQHTVSRCHFTKTNFHTLLSQRTKNITISFQDKTMLKTRCQLDFIAKQIFLQEDIADPCTMKDGQIWKHICQYLFQCLIVAKFFIINAGKLLQILILVACLSMILVYKAKQTHENRFFEKTF